MVTKGKTRGNPVQLATYLLRKAENDNVRLLSIRGTCNPNDLKLSLLEMDLTSELTKSDKGLYHAQICPAYGEDKSMTDADWERAADILEQQIGFKDQKRAIVLHDKKDKIHAHVVWERYDHERSIMKSDSFSGYAHGRARVVMEKEFGHERTPERNPHVPEMKEYLSQVWGQTKDAESFMQVIAKQGYVVAAGKERPFRVVDARGRAFDLVRQLESAKTKDVRKRFKNTKLIDEKEAIEQVRIKQRARPQEKQCAKKKEQQPVKSVKRKTPANNKLVTERQQHADQSKTISMQGSFKVEPNKLEELFPKIDEKEAKKRELIERINKARAFSENERDM